MLTCAIVKAVGRLASTQSEPARKAAALTFADCAYSVAGWPRVRPRYAPKTSEHKAARRREGRWHRRFAIGRVCVVADRAMISDETILVGLEHRGLEYAS